MAIDDTRKYISLAKLENFLEKCKTFFALAQHTHKAGDIAGIPIVDSKLDKDSINTVQNKAVTEKINELDNKLTYKVQLITWEAND